MRPPRLLLLPRARALPPRRGAARWAVALLACAGLAACRDVNPAATAGAPAVGPAVHPPGYVVDSAIPIEEALRRFRAGLPAVTALDSASATSRDGLVRAFARAVAARDTARLRRLAISRTEFAYLYYPSTRYVRPPSELAPDALWFLSGQASAKGLRRVVERLGGSTFRLIGYQCEGEPVREGENRLWQHCTVELSTPGAAGPQRRRLFGSILARGGRYKFVSYVNDF